MRTNKCNRCVVYHSDTCLCYSRPTPPSFTTDPALHNFLSPVLLQLETRHTHTHTHLGAKMETSSMSNSAKRFISGNEQVRMSHHLAESVYDSGFRPDMIIALWRGGAFVGVCVQEYLQFLETPSGGKTRPIVTVSVRTSSRESGTGEQKKVVDIHGTNYCVRKLKKKPGSRVLIVDDVFDSGRTMEALLADFKRRLGEETIPTVFKVAVTFYKPKRRAVNLVPDYYVESTDDWLVFPHEMDGLTLADIAKRNQKGYGGHTVIVPAGDPDGILAKAGVHGYTYAKFSDLDDREWVFKLRHRGVTYKIAGAFGEHSLPVLHAKVSVQNLLAGQPYEIDCAL